MIPVDLERLPDYLQSQRWYGGKAWPVKSMQLVDHAQIPLPDGRAFTLAVIEVIYAVGTPERYLLPITPDTNDPAEDALNNDDALRALLDIIRDGKSLPSASGQLVGERIRARGADELPEKPEIRRLQVEQSNTSVVLGEKVILKIIRKLEPGVNPEHEVGRFLAMRTQFRATPTLLGALHLESATGMTVGVLHAFVPNATDGWQHTLAAMKKGAQPAFLEELRSLGRRVAELHLALASDPDDPAFAPEPLQLEDLQGWSASIIGEMGVTFAQAGTIAPHLADLREKLMDRVRRLTSLEPGGQKIRVHGDLHLGQVLYAKDSWLLFDFEGEPGRAFVARRQKHSALRDVAGMLRSFVYAGATAGGLEQNKAMIAECRKQFLDGYFEVAKTGQFLPENPQTLEVLLDVLELEKVLYEVRYELQNRPDWVQIPLQSLL